MKKHFESNSGKIERKDQIWDYLLKLPENFSRVALGLGLNQILPRDEAESWHKNLSAMIQDLDENPIVLID